MTFDLTEFHALINEVLSPRFQTSADLRRMKCERLVALLDMARAIVANELATYVEPPKEQTIRHTLDNTPLIPPDDEEDDVAERGETIHYEK